SVAMLVLRWQETGSDQTLETLLGIVVPELLRVIGETLRQRGIRDPAAAEDALSLVLDHLRRLRGSGSDRRVAPFLPTRANPRTRRERDPGVCYLRQLARARASDVARARRRRRSVPFSALDPAAGTSFEQAIAAPCCGDPETPSACERLAEAVRELEPRQRLVVELLLEGKSQAVIAHVLGVNEGTVSRLRARAITSLRRILDP
ncbi:MAG: sigma-70 family RNA polymerase sigma factor, partial [Planctomycetota bacterium]